MSITVYSTTTCPYCQMLKDYLSEQKVAFTEKIIDQDEVAREQMAKDSGGFLGVPFTVIENEGKKETVIGFDKNRLAQILGIGQ